MSSTQENHHAIGGAVWCLMAAFAYTTSNVCMRQLTALHCDPFWVVFGRETVAALLVSPWLAYRAVRGWPTLPSGSPLRNLLLVGVLIQVVGNICFQWALGIVGLAVTVPAVFAVSITMGAILGLLILGERVSARSLAAMGLLLASLALLGMGAEAVGRSIANTDAVSPAIIALGVAAAGLAGGVFTLLNIVVRHSVTRTTLPCAVAFLIPLTGTLSLGPIALLRSGMPDLASASWEHVLLMAGAGLFNIIGFLAIIHGLQRTTIVYANAVNASQVALAAVAGMTLFAEPPNPWLLVGIALTIVGVVCIERPVEAIEDMPPL